jgi:hypothetical protein
LVSHGRKSDQSTEAPAPATSTDEIERLASLRDRGVLTEDEFSAASGSCSGSGSSPAAQAADRD